MRKRAGILFIISGLILMVAAIYIICDSLYEQRITETKTDAVLATLKEKIYKEADDDKDSYFDAETLEKDYNDAREKKIENTESVARVDENDYIGFIRVPYLEIEIPVMSEYRYELLGIAPCRYSGSYLTSDMVIAGHNYKRHFRSFKKLRAGDVVEFITVSGVKYSYLVSDTIVLKPEQVDKLLEKDESNNWELSLFTCSNGGTARFVIRCKFFSKNY